MSHARQRYFGKGLRAFAQQLSEQILASEAPHSVREQAVQVLQGIAESGEWLINHPEFPSLPDRPGFIMRPGPGKNRSKIPIPAERRAAFNNRTHLYCYWPGEGHTAYTHYVAEIDRRVSEASLPDNPQDPSATVDLDAIPLDDIRHLDRFKGRTSMDIDLAAEILFRCRAIGGRKRKERLDQVRGHWRQVVGYLDSRKSLRIDHIDEGRLEDFRAWCEEQLKDKVLKLKTVNNYLYVFRVVLPTSQPPPDCT